MKRGTPLNGASDIDRMQIAMCSHLEYDLFERLLLCCF